MTIQVDKTIEQKAIDLRTQGMSYKKIVLELKEHGATEWWVKSVTKGVQKKSTPSQEAIKSILPLATRPQGVKQFECYNIYLELFGTVWDKKQGRQVINITQSTKAYIKTEVKKLAEKAGKVAIFVPDWLDREQPRESLNTMLESAQYLQDILQDCIQDYKALYGDCSSFSVENELLSLAFRGYTPEPVESRCERNLEIVNDLLQVGEKHTPAQVQKPTAPTENVLADCGYEDIMDYGYEDDNSPSPDEMEDMLNQLYNGL